MLHKILHASGKRAQAYRACRDVLSHFNETVPDKVDPSRMSKILKQTESQLGKLSDDDWVNMKEMESSSSQALLKFYADMTMASYYQQPELLPYYCCRMIEITLANGVCSDSVIAFVLYSSTLCHQSILYIETACRVGRWAMSILLKRYHSPELLAKLYFNYYGFIVIHTQPFEECIEKLRNGYKGTCTYPQKRHTEEMKAGQYPRPPCFVLTLSFPLEKVGMTVGDMPCALQCSIFIVRFGILSGRKLVPLLEETEYYLKLATLHDHTLCITFLSLYREVISALIDKG